MFRLSFVMFDLCLGRICLLPASAEFEEKGLNFRTALCEILKNENTVLTFGQVSSRNQGPLKSINSLPCNVKKQTSSSELRSTLNLEEAATLSEICDASVE